MGQYSRIAIAYLVMTMITGYFLLWNYIQTWFYSSSGFYGTTCKDKFSVHPSHSACLQPSSQAQPGTVDDTAVLTAHNTKRQEASTKFTATDMLKMVWDTEVAMVAQKWAENCQNKHDENSDRMIPGRFTVGQNIAQSDSLMTWDAVVKLWYDEEIYFTYGGPNEFGKVGHFTQVVWAKSYMLGCGYSKCGNKHFYVCNYAPAGNSPSSLIDTPFNKSGSACKTKVNNLCDCGSVKCDGNAVLNHATCQCKCDPSVNFFTAPNCQLTCTGAQDNTFCGTFYKSDSCRSMSNVPFICPNLCNVCPYAGTEYTEGSVTVTQPNNHDNSAPLFSESLHTSVTTLLSTLLVLLLNS